MESDALADLLRKIGAGPISEIQQVGGGRNSQVFRVSCQRENHYLAKFYFSHPSDSRDRLGNEFRAYEMLRKHGVTCVPEPLAYDQQINLALFEYLEGEAIRPEAVTQPMIDETVGFVESLKNIAATGNLSNVPPASEACFSIASLQLSIDLRLASLVQAARAVSSLQEFLETELLPFRQRVGDGCREVCSRLGWDLEAELGVDSRTLSPSDFGFHNAIRRPNGSLAFFDFEYFGWDDPAKIIADFLLHPAMQLSSRHKDRFVDRMFQCFANDHALKKRTELVYPLFGLKWCCILLNEFVPQHQSRRSFANMSEGSLTSIQTKQLRKAAALLKRLNHEFQRYPIHS
jgi:hypothetical protein